MADGIDRWTDVRQFHKPCSMYYVGSANDKTTRTSVSVSLMSSDDASPIVGSLGCDQRITVAAGVSPVQFAGESTFLISKHLAKLQTK